MGLELQCTFHPRGPSINQFWDLNCIRFRPHAATKNPAIEADGVAGAGIHADVLRSAGIRVLVDEDEEDVAFADDTGAVRLGFPPARPLLAGARRDEVIHGHPHGLQQPAIQLVRSCLGSHLKRGLCVERREHDAPVPFPGCGQRPMRAHTAREKQRGQRRAHRGDDTGPQGPTSTVRMAQSTPPRPSRATTQRVIRSGALDVW